MNGEEEKQDKAQDDATFKAATKGRQTKAKAKMKAVAEVMEKEKQKGKGPQNEGSCGGDQEGDAE